MQEKDYRDGQIERNRDEETCREMKEKRWGQGAGQRDGAGRRGRRKGG